MGQLIREYRGNWYCIHCNTAVMGSLRAGTGTGLAGWGSKGDDFNTRVAL